MHRLGIEGCNTSADLVNYGPEDCLILSRACTRTSNDNILSIVLNRCRTSTIPRHFGLQFVIFDNREVIGRY